MSVPHRSTEPARPRHRAPDTLVDFHTVHDRGRVRGLDLGVDELDELVREGAGVRDRVDDGVGRRAEGRELLLEGRAEHERVGGEGRGDGERRRDGEDAGRELLARRLDLGLGARVERGGGTEAERDEGLLERHFSYICGGRARFCTSGSRDDDDNESVYV